MTFIVILIAWVLLQRLGPDFMRAHDRWLEAWQMRGSAALSVVPVRIRLLLLAGLPGALVALLAWVVSPWLAGLWLLLLDLLVLAYSLGRGNYRAELDNYLERWQRGDLEAAYQVAQQSFGRGLNGEEDLSADSAQQLHQQMRRAALYTGLERWFAVVFWFALLGPGLALTYRLLHLLRQQAAPDIPERMWLAQWLEWLDWLPARLLGLAFAIIGDFVSCMRSWRDHFFGQHSVRDLLVIYAERSVPHAEAGVRELGDEHFVELAAHEIRELRDLMRRSTMCWLVALALLQMI